MSREENIYRDGAALERYIERSIGRLDGKDREAARRGKSPGRRAM